MGKKNLSGQKIAQNATSHRNATTKGGSVNSKVENKYEARPNKSLKHTILGKRSRGVERNVAEARSKAYEQRTKTLLVDFLGRSKANTFVDNRLGANNPDLSKEDKMLLRLQTARSKKSLYQLDDAKEDKLTHYGQSLGDLLEREEDHGDDEENLRRYLESATSKKNNLKYDRVGDNDDDDEDDKGFDATELIRRLQAGEDLVKPNGEKKTRKEIMEEVMMKSKLFKMARQKAKEEDEAERLRLDDAIASLMKTDKTIELKPTKKEKEREDFERIMAKHNLRIQEEDDDHAEKPVVSELSSRKRILSDAEDSETKSDADDDGFDFEKVARELQFEARAAAASDRTKTPEEIAKEERERLEELEQQRLRRMMGEATGDDEDDASDEDEEDNDDEDNHKDSDRQRRKKKKAKTASAVAKLEELKKGIKSSELPYVLECPESHIELLELLHEYPKASLDDAIRRIRITNSIHLHADNRAKLTRLADILVEHLVYISERSCRGLYDRDSGDVDIVAQHLFDLAQEMPATLAGIFGMRLQHLQKGLEMHLENAQSYGKTFGGDLGEEGLEFNHNITMPAGKRLHKRGGWVKGAKGRRALEEEHEEASRAAQIRGDSEIALSDCRCWPTVGDFVFFKTLAAIFPVTDYRHIVISPAQLLLGHFLSSAPIRGPGDIVAAIFTAQLLCEYTAPGKRLAPEIIVSIDAILRQCNPQLNSEPVANEMMTLPLSIDVGHLTAFEHLRKAFTDTKNTKSAKKQELQLHWMVSGEELTTSDWKRLGLHMLSILSCEADAVQDALSYDVLFGNTVIYLDRVCATSSKGSLKESAEALKSKLERSIEHAIRNREPLQMQAFKPKAINSIAPKIISEKKSGFTTSSGANDPERDRIMERKLKKQVKRERKGVARNLRLDARFLAEHRRKEKDAIANERAAKRKADRAFLQNEARDINEYVKEGGKLHGGGTRGLDLKGKRRR